MPPSRCAPWATPFLNDGREGTPTAPGTAEVLPIVRRLAAGLDVPARVGAEVHGGDECSEAGAQAALLERIVSPLLANALRYAHSHVIVEARRTPDGVPIDAADDGPGVPESFTGQLFKPGRRADPDDGHRGAGLGLPLARRLARSAGGEAHHDSRHTQAPGS
ncbi:sensor histidine kinase [Streptomyces sp. NPDC051172]|uniref:sensor histidine kinase n=1 Tax=Streptomyces sp. NPDC051172 TaxID=3155796 RepID=UPI003446A7CA